ncbi:MAG TPA: TetR/AcrR family transcriptional regulator [Microbacterium sp.]|nr:TetR/AcrR family transcriptional regulator [Microbacterium sp.]
MTNSPETSSDDPRALRSRARLKDALVRLLEREDLSGIGVAELCREAGVHRTTFYGHYDSVGQLAAEVYASIIDEASAVEPPKDLSLDELARTYLATAVSILEAVRKDRRQIRSLLDSSVSLGFRKQMREHFVRRSAEAIDVMRDHGLSLPDNTDVGAAFIAGGTVSSIELWASIDDADAETFARRMFANMPAWWPQP